jgi:hypothetical protein
LSNCAIEQLGNLKTTALRVRLSISQLPNFPITQLFHFLMRRVLAATVAEFLEFQPFRRRFAVLSRRIVPLFAITAL